MRNTDCCLPWSKRSVDSLSPCCNGPFGQKCRTGNSTAKSVLVLKGMRTRNTSMLLHPSVCARIKSLRWNVTAWNSPPMDKKEKILHDFYTNLLGTAHQPHWAFSLHTLYTASTASLRSLAAPFTDDEIATAFLSANQNASPGPDGFGPGFYRRAWATVKPKIKAFMTSFSIEIPIYQGSTVPTLLCCPRKTAPGPQTPFSLSHSKMGL